MRKTAVMSQ